MPNRGRRTTDKPSGQSPKRPTVPRAKKTTNPFIFDRVTPDDPNHDLIKGAFLKTWADSHGLVADAHAGKVTFSNFIDRCVANFEQGANVHIAFVDATTVSDRCDELDRMAKKSIALLRSKITPAAQRLGRRNVKAALEEFSRRVGEITARSKQTILSDALELAADQAEAETPHVRVAEKSAIEFHEATAEKSEAELPEGRSAVVLKKKRGRPAQIDIATKDAALAARERHASWKEVAKILYSSRYPTAQQTKNAPNVLKHYRLTRVRNNS